MPIEPAVRKLTGEPADLFGFVDRGYVREGGWADLVRLRPGARSRPGPIRRVRDFPADGERLTAEEPVGLRHVLVNGTPIRRDEVQLDSTVRPGMRPELARRKLMGLLDGKVAVITGAGSGMAKASTKLFVAEGARVGGGRHQRGGEGHRRRGRRRGAARCTAT